MDSDSVMLSIARPIEERVRALYAAWVDAGRDPECLVTGEAFFALYCWSHNHGTTDPHSPEYDAGLAEYITAAYDHIGGRAGWDALLNQRAYCPTCEWMFNLENIGMCTGCMRYTCYGCGAHTHCAGELL